MVSLKIDLKFISNWKTMFWVISKAQHSIKWHWNLLKLAAIFIAWLMKKTYLAVHLTSRPSHLFCEFVGRQKSCGFNNKVFSACWNTNQTTIFSLSTRYKWVNSIYWSTKLTLTRQGLIYKTPVFYLFHLGKNWKVQPRAMFKIPAFNLCVNWEK